MRAHLLTFLDDCGRRSEDIAFVHHRHLRSTRWSYGKLRSTAFQFARELHQRNINKGDRVLMWGENSAEWIAAFFGCLIRGAIVVPLDRHSAPAFARRVHSQVTAKLLLKGNVDASDFDASVPVIDLDDLTSLTSHHSDARMEIENIATDDIAEIIFTSGTTAEPKGVCISHRNIVANLEPIEREIQKYLKWERPFHPIRFLNLVPLSHVFGQFMGIFVPQLIGGEVFFLDSLNPADIISLTRRERVSVIVAVPRQIDSLREKIERDYKAAGRESEFHRKLEEADRHHFLRRWWDFRRVHRRFGWKFWAMVSGGATLDAETENFWRRLGYAVVQGYGMTETASIITVNHPFKLSRGSIGKTIPGQEVRLDENGEIMVRGAGVSPGYWSRGVKPLTDEEGWLRTGDVGERDEEGNLYFRGRKKDCIVTAAGLNIYPEDLEAALNHQPQVKEACVIGVEGARGPEPMAVLILRDERADLAEITGRANESLAEFQRIRRWAVWAEEDFPRTATTHKIIKRKVAEALSDQAAEKKSRDGSALAEMIAEMSGSAPARIDPRASLAADLKLDSLGRVELMSAIEDRFQIDIDEGAFTAATTLGDIEKMIREGAQPSAVEYPYPAWSRRAIVRWVRLAVYYLVILPVTRLMCWPRVEGRERLSEARGPLLFVSNHVSMVDHGLILAALPRRFRHRLAIAMEGERLRDWRRPPASMNWFARLWLPVQYGLVVALFNVFPLPQRSGFRRSFAYAGEAVDRGSSVLVFPEGRTTEDGRMNRFMSGTGLLASNLDIAVVPIKIEGLFELKQRRKYFSRSGAVKIIFGEPVRFDRDRDPAEITAELQSRVAGLSSETI
ncbi:MAG: AMP-binding protein [Acidobacteriota bacterium]